LSCWLAVIKVRKQKTSEQLYAWRETYKETIMTKTVTTRYDVAEHLRTPEEMAAYLEACLEEADGDAAFIAKALGDIARAKGMTQVARDAGVSRESLYKALSGERIPGFDTILKVTRALGLRLHAEVANMAHQEASADA
jgi:probable addiction module antidote protein